DQARAARRRIHEGRGAQSAAASNRPARRRRSDGLLFPQHRSERRLLPRDDPARGVPTDPDHHAPAGAQSLMATHETDILIIGGGITSAMLALKLAEQKPGARITVVEAGRSIFDVGNRGRYRERAAAYGEHPWHDDYIEDQQAAGIISMTMAV